MMRNTPYSDVALKPRSRTAWAGYAACVLALGHAAVSFYWASGGTAGLSTVGGELEAMGRAASPLLSVVVWGVGTAKVAAGLLALALVMPWGRMFPRWAMLAAGWGGATLLALYGGVLVTVEALVVGGITVPSGPVDWTALKWHLFLWDPWFFGWGVLLGVAAWHYTRSSHSERHAQKKPVQ
jgi:hypothetical protein